MDAILGRDDRLVEKTVKACKRLDCSFIAIIGTPVPSVIGTDYKALKKMIEKKTGLPVVTVDTNGMELREGTVGNDHYAAEDQLENPYEMHFVTSLSNGSEGYIPSYDGFTNGGYERDTTKYAQGTGELIVGDVLHVLNDLHK